MVYVQCPAGELYLEEPADVRRCKLALDHLRTKAIEPQYVRVYLENALYKYDEM